MMNNLLIATDPGKLAEQDRRASPACSNDADRTDTVAFRPIALETGDAVREEIGSDEFLGKVDTHRTEDPHCFSFPSCMQ